MTFFFFFNQVVCTAPCPNLVSLKDAVYNRDGITLHIWNLNSLKKRQREHSQPACSYRPQVISCDGEDVAFSVVSVFLNTGRASLWAGTLVGFCSLFPSRTWGQKMFCSCMMVCCGEVVLTDSAGYKEAGSCFRFILYLNGLPLGAGLCLT